MTTYVKTENEEEREPTALDIVPDVPEPEKKKRKKRDPNVPKRAPTLWQLFIKEETAGKKFANKEERSHYMSTIKHKYHQRKSDQVCDLPNKPPAIPL
jgi:hypothetical protein